MNWENVLKDDIEKGVLKDFKDYFVKYLKSRKFKKLTSKYISEIGGDTIMGWGSQLQPRLQGDWPSQYYDDEEWERAGRVFKWEVERKFMSELDEQWDDMWSKRKRQRLSDANYVPDDMDGA